jgi:hypothetical protein
MGGRQASERNQPYDAGTPSAVELAAVGGGVVVIMAVEDLDSVEATLEPLRDPAAQQRIAEAEAEIARGRGRTKPVSPYPAV